MRRATAPQPDLFAYVPQPRATAPPAHPSTRGLPLFKTILQRAQRLSRVTPVAPDVVRDDGVVPMTIEDAVSWSRQWGLEWPPEEGIMFKLGVRDQTGAVVAVCIGAKPYEHAPERSVELAVIAPRSVADETALQEWRRKGRRGTEPPANTPYSIALDRGARAALALGYEHLYFYRPDDLGHPVDLFEPITPRPYRFDKGGSLPWRSDGLIETTPWLRSLSDQSRRHRAAYLAQQQANAAVEWELAKMAREEEMGDLLDEESESQLAAEFGFDYYDGWRPDDVTLGDMEDFLAETEDDLFERFSLDVPPSGRALFVAQISKGEVNAVLPSWHSHLKRPVRGHLFSLGVFARAVPGVYPTHLRAVCVVSMPNAQAFTGLTSAGVPRGIAEVTRVAVNSNAPPLVGLKTRDDGKVHRASEASFVLKRAEDACRALGFNRVVSSILLGEKGASYRAAGWKAVAVTRPGEWSREGREREDAEQPGWKIRLETGPGAAEPVRDPDAKALGWEGTVDRLLRDAAELYAVGKMGLGGEPPEKSNGQDLSPFMVDALLALARAFSTTEPTVWSIPKNIGGALVSRGLATPETYRHQGRYGRFGLHSRRATMKYVVDVGYTITPKGLAAVQAMGAS